MHTSDFFSLLNLTFVSNGTVMHLSEIVTRSILKWLMKNKYKYKLSHFGSFVSALNPASFSFLVRVVACSTAVSSLQTCAAVCLCCGRAERHTEHQQTLPVKTL